MNVAALPVKQVHTQRDITLLLALFLASCTAWFLHRTFLLLFQAITLTMLAGIASGLPTEMHRLMI